jgi:hypothetical protein
LVGTVEDVVVDEVDEVGVVVGGVSGAQAPITRAAATAATAPSALRRVFDGCFIRYSSLLM